MKKEKSLDFKSLNKNSINNKNKNNINCFSNNIIFVKRKISNGIKNFHQVIWVYSKYLLVNC